MQSFEVVPIEEAVDYYTSCLKSNDTSSQLWNYRGATYDILGEVDKASEDFTRAFDLSIDSAIIVNRGMVLLDDKQEFERAIADFQKALAIRPSDHRAHACLAVAYRMTGELEKSLASINAAIRYIPTRGSYYCDRAYVHAAARRLDAMNADLQEAAKRSPEDRWVWLQRAWLRATSTDDAHRNGPQAIEDATTACELTHWVDETSLDHLAAAYAESGDFAKAIEWEEKAIQLCPVPRRPKLESRLELYKQSKPFREPLIRTQPN
jgi:tetratricopeptide (TPR) repeat protein